MVYFSMGLVLHSGLCSKCSVPHSHFGGGHGHSHGSEKHVEEANESSALNGQSEHRGRNINVRAAFVHVIGDLVQSIGVLCAAIIIKIKVRSKVTTYNLTNMGMNGLTQMTILWKWETKNYISPMHKNITLVITNVNFIEVCM